MQPTDTSNASLQWEESRIPPTYVASNGPCRIASIGKDYGRAIAIAASRGLCVLDLSRMHRQIPRWKQFGNINDEQRFRVASMIWWELDDEDFLLAAVQYISVGTLHVVCWSRKR